MGRRYYSLLLRSLISLRRMIYRSQGRNLLSGRRRNELYHTVGNRFVMMIIFIYFSFSPSTLSNLRSIRVTPVRRKGKRERRKCEERWKCQSYETKRNERWRAVAAAAREATGAGSPCYGGVWIACVVVAVVLCGVSWCCGVLSLRAVFLFFLFLFLFYVFVFLFLVHRIVGVSACIISCIIICDCS